jgi:two-component system OmpR family sensor kinase
LDFGRRLFFVTALEMASVLCTLTIAGALFVFGSFVSTVQGDLGNTLTWLQAALDSSPASRDAKAAGDVAASHYVRSDIVVLIFDQRRRVDVYKVRRYDAQPVVEIATRATPLPGTVTTAPFAQLVLGVATAFGLHSVRAHVGDVDLIVRESDAALTSAVAVFAPEFFAALALSLLLGFAIARILTQQALQPLVDVTGALERFAAGDLEPHPIAADRRQQFGRLALAYNAAIDRMQRAFAERDRANDSMRQFIADAGHQLRTPLTVVRGFIAILRKGDLRTPEDRDRILETMARQSALMSSLVDKLMLLDRWEDEGARASSEPIDVSRLVADVVAPLAEARADRVVRVEAPSPELAAIEPIELSHAITNLVDNALKYTTGAIDVTVERSGKHVVVTVRDEGPGMSPDEVAHAFDRFFRGSRRDVDGTGLGLPIARRAIERAGGTLSLRSDPATGSTFTIALPSAGSAERGPSPARIPVAPA